MALMTFKNNLKFSLTTSLVNLRNEVETIHEDFETKMKDITDSEWKKMFSDTQTILKDSIKKGGDSLSDYRNAFGEKGQFQNFHKAYRQTGKPCPKKNCAGIIQRTVIGGRSTHYCNVHQT